MPRKPFNPDLIGVPPEDKLFGGAAGAGAGGGAGDGPLTVSQLTAMVKGALSRLPAKLAVVGEVSNFTRSPNGHLYFTLKDESAAVNCVMWKSAAGKLKFAPQNGLAVVAFGQIDVYEPRGQYQLYVTKLVPHGRGELELAFRQLCEKLEKLGWFEPERKRPIPRIPGTIGVVTSRTGAAIRDILRTLAVRWPAARVIVADTRVQGEASADAVAEAIGRMNRHAAAVGGVDVVIVARGGGSLEDLWAFNTETVARAILNSRIPIVCGIGHEVDVTIADLVADLRAATPTAAAAAVVPDRREMAGRLARLAAMLTRRPGQVLGELQAGLAILTRSEVLRRPESILRGRRQALDELISRLRQQSPRQRLAQGGRDLDRGQALLHAAAGRYLVGRLQRVEAGWRQLLAYDPREVLNRGYSMTRLKATGRLVTAAGQVRPGDRLITELAEGKVESEVTDRTNAAARQALPARPGEPGGGQMDLFGKGANDGGEKSKR